MDIEMIRRCSRSYGRISNRLGLSVARFTAYWLLALFVLTATLSVRNASSRDPGSWFFNPEVAYKPEYSAVRLRQAERFIATHTTTTPVHDKDNTPGICIGIPSVARDGASYLSTTVGSLLAGLTGEERDGVELMVFLAHTDPTIHPAYHEPWLWHLADEVLLYNLSREELEYVQSLEREDVEHRTKGLYDYTYLLEACHATETPYIAMIEDDVIAMDGWYHRTVEGILQASSASSGDFLYLRMFYTEEFLGWNSEYWYIYASCSIAVMVWSTYLVHWARSNCPVMKRALTPYFSLAICTILVPWAIVLTFAAGRATVLPLPQGINPMNNFGCCAQGLVFPRHKAHDLIEWFRTSKVGFADMLMEQFADEHGEQRWALTPSVLQHVGGKSSKPEDFGHGVKYEKSVAGTIWNFGFELNEPKALREEHALAGLDPVKIE